MLNVLIEDNDIFFNKGMEELLEELIFERKRCGVKFYDYDEESIKSADVIIKKIEPGESFICHPTLLHRKSHSLIFGVYEGENVARKEQIPMCLSDIIYINRTNSLNKTKEIISHGLSGYFLYPEVKLARNCTRCRCRTLTAQQALLTDYFAQGKTLSDAAPGMGIGVKIASSHKRSMMNRFGLTNTFELMSFIRKFKGDV